MPSRAHYYPLLTPPLQNLLPLRTSPIAHPSPAIHIFPSSAHASAFQGRSRGAYDWFLDEWPENESKSEAAREGWSAPHGFTRVKGLRVDVTRFIRESVAAFGDMGAFERCIVAEEELGLRAHSHPIMWRQVAARSIIWAIGEHSPSLSAFHRSSSFCDKRGGSNSHSQVQSTRPLLRQTFGSISVLRCPGLHTLSSLHFEGKWLCPAPSSTLQPSSSILQTTPSAIYLAGSSYSPSSTAALHEAPGIIASLLPLLPAPPQLIRSQSQPPATLSHLTTLSLTHSPTRRPLPFAAPALVVA